MRLYAGIDMGGTGTRFLLYGQRRVLAQRTVPTAELAQGSRATKLARLAGIVQELLPAGSRLVSVGIGASGPVDTAKGVIRNPDTLAGFSGFRIVDGLERHLGVPVYLDNDALVAAIAEYRLGAGRKATRLLVITLGTGIGVAVLIDGQALRGLQGAHPEASHFPVSSEGDPCYCGITGCWEHLASRAALQNLLRPLVPAATPDRAILACAVKQARRKAVQKAFYDYGVLVGRGLIALQAHYMPDCTVIGGSAAAQYPYFKTGLTATLHEARQLAQGTRIKVSTLGDGAGALGAAIMAREAQSP